MKQHLQDKVKLIEKLKEVREDLKNFELKLQIFQLNGELQHAHILNESISALQNKITLLKELVNSDKEILEEKITILRTEKDILNERLANIKGELQHAHILNSLGEQLELECEILEEVNTILRTEKDILNERLAN
ncbi:hypothetical protein QYM36_005823 [Artemia franciscana]|uniref:Uncharacterized protein n=1 Tax=Artemia franciscana TaxID=6661 RepID=A0AA88HZ69_ARTSF|nr:hypothetical protein QYM36_005823 [Artemia franciscana]